MITNLYKFTYKFDVNQNGKKEKFCTFVTGDIKQSAIEKFKTKFPHVPIDRIDLIVRSIDDSQLMVIKRVLIELYYEEPSRIDKLVE